MRRAMVSSTILRIELLVSLFLLIAIPGFADSHARMVRLSDVQGDVQVDRNLGQGFEKAFLNLPLSQGMRVRTGEQGQAALEFEDGSAIRLAPNTTIDLPQLLLKDSGTKVSTVSLQDGTAYVNFLGTKDNSLDVTFARETLTFTAAAHLRVALADVDASVAVFKGEATIAGPKGTVEVKKNHTADFDLIDDHSEIANNIEQYPYDSWDKQQSEYQQQYVSKSYSNYAPYAYGSDDLNYYGSFFSLPGYGMMWQPYFIGAGWDPFMNGAWAFYPGAGYGWVSSYPWGWTPYHYGSWTYLSPYGWCWKPGGAWMGWNTVPVITNAPVGYLPPRAPLLPGRRIFPVSRGSVPTQSLSKQSGNKMSIVSNSAGLGIPRGSIRNLGQLSTRVERQGFATTSLHTSSLGSPGFWHSSSAPFTRMGTSAGHGMSSMGHSMGGGGGGHSGGGGGHK